MACMKFFAKLVSLYLLCIKWTEYILLTSKLDKRQSKSDLFDMQECYSNQF